MGAFSEDLMTIVLPVTRAGASLKITAATGMFQGVMPAVTPNGWRSVMLTKPGVFRELSPLESQALPA